MGGLNSTFASYCLWTCPLWNVLKNIFYKKVLYLVGKYIQNFCPKSENFYFLENMLTCWFFYAETKSGFSYLSDSFYSLYSRRAEILRKFVKRWKNMIPASAGTCILSKIAIPFLQGQQLRCICSNFRPHDGVISDQWCHTERKYFQFSTNISQLLL